MRRMMRSPIIVVALLFVLFRTFGSRGIDLSSFLALGAVSTVALLAIVIIFWWKKRQDQRTRTARMEETRNDLRRRLDDVANDILRLEEQVKMSDDGAALAYFRDASVAYASILKDLDHAHGTRELSRLATRLDTAIWNLDAADATIAGQPLPPRPRQTLGQSSQRGQGADRAGQVGVGGAPDVINGLIERRYAHPSRGSERHRSRHC